MKGVPVRTYYARTGRKVGKRIRENAERLFHDEAQRNTVFALGAHGDETASEM
jgi:hypothetical protein